MAKFQVSLMRSVQQSCVVEITVLASDVKEAYDLDRDDDWRDYVDQWIADNADLASEVDSQGPDIAQDENEEWEVEDVVE